MASYHQEPELTLTDGLKANAPHSIGRRAPFTWDWYLPFLRTLRLTSEFAFLFQFRMLVGYPSLQCLVLDIEIPEQSHLRVLTLNNFIHDDANIGPVLDGDSLLPFTKTLSSPGNPPPLIKTRIERLFLAGGWIFDGDLRTTAFDAVLPNLAFLQETSTAGYSVRGWFQALRKLSRLRRFVGHMTRI